MLLQAHVENHTPLEQSEKLDATLSGGSNIRRYHF